ncbi:kinase adenylate kinase [Phaeodactylum tricornutum CCAP 1055/1]|jgi:adenylate kinase|uniref:Kinase adenylate kinase n=2 Tax=Phaeodactylum tricornutum TaxID=2850 RepID=B7FYD8_PHATC|nr:kinase adenylate kinase [Phaeodactylum tricornutum CCAP 1055/1]EEC48904.1 kinase adenylate kinase [Phaeodactylum tricornutum CCAP 1055/1]|eukprot:XP_002179918.1 kinase adenylate kinase [Phaeodactylum tricornutum CCAP 1055/1]
MLRSLAFTASVALLFSLDPLLAFAPIRTTTSVASPSGVSIRAQTGDQLFAAAQDDNFEGIDLVKLLGKKQLKRMARKSQSHRRSDKPAGPKASIGAGFVAKDPVKIIIAGAPASGKGTQCETIKEKFGVVHLSTGDMLRAAVAAQTPVGKQAKEYMDSGKLVPDDVIIGVVKNRLIEKDCQSQGWLLDGFPRTQAQALALEDAGVCADCFIFLNVPDSVLVERVVGRRTDPDTGKIYHMTFSPPEDEEIKARLVQRSDDTEQKVKVRLEQFHDNVDAVKDKYTNIMVTVDGNQAPTQVSKEILEAIEEKVGSKVGV